MKAKLNKIDINEKLDARNLKLIGPYEGSSKPAKFKCLVCGRGWVDIARYVLNTDKTCPMCKGNSVYYLYIFDLHDGRSKIGISNSPYRRSRDFKSRNGLDKVSVTHVWAYTDRDEAEGVESIVKGLMYNRRDPQNLIEGGTEVFFADSDTMLEAIRTAKDAMVKFAG